MQNVIGMILHQPVQSHNVMMVTCKPYRKLRNAMIGRASYEALGQLDV
jgi:sortase (surface protein transpeptidase)